MRRSARRRSARGVPRPGAVEVEVLYRDDDVVSAVASGGPVTLTRYDDLGTAGTYLLTTSDDTIAGAFDVERYDP